MMHIVSDKPTKQHRSSGFPVWPPAQSTRGTALRPLHPNQHRQDRLRAGTDLNGTIVYYEQHSDGIDAWKLLRRARDDECVHVQQALDQGLLTKVLLARGGSVFFAVRLKDATIKGMIEKPNTPMARVVRAFYEVGYRDVFDEAMQDDVGAVRKWIGFEGISETIFQAILDRLYIRIVQTGVKQFSITQHQCTDAAAPKTQFYLDGGKEEGLPWRTFSLEQLLKEIPHFGPLQVSLAAE